MSLLDRRKKQRRKNAEPSRVPVAYVVPDSRVVTENGKKKLVFEAPSSTDMTAIREEVLAEARKKEAARQARKAKAKVAA